MTSDEGAGWRWPDGDGLRGPSRVGADGETVGEVVFNTSMTGYQEILTDPSYAGQIVTMTVPRDRQRRDRTPATRSRARRTRSGMVARACARSRRTGARSESLDAVPRAHGVAGHRGHRHPQAGAPPAHARRAAWAIIDAERRAPRGAGRARRASAPGMEGRDLAAGISTKRPTRCDRGRRRRVGEPAAGAASPTARGGLRLRPQEAPCCTPGRRRLPGDGGARRARPPTEVLARKPDGVFLSNGPGDPAAVDYAVEAVRARCSARCRCSASAWATRSSRWRSAARPTSSSSATAAPTSRSRICARQGGDHLAEPRLRGGRRSLEGKAEVTHINLNDRTVEGIAAPELRCSACSTTPRPPPGRTTRATCSAVSCR